MKEIQGRSQDFSKGGSQRLLTRSPSRDRRLQEPLTKILYKKKNFKKVGFSTMAFTAKILS